MRFSRAWRRQSQLRKHLPHPSPQQKPQSLRNRTYGGKAKRWRRNVSGGYERIRTPHILSWDWGGPLPASRSPCSSANAQAEIPWLATWQCLRAGRLLGHLVTNLTWVRGATACWGFCGPLCGHLLSCLYTQPGLILICWVQIPTVNKAPLHFWHVHNTKQFLPILSSSTPKKQKHVCCAL